MNEIMLYETDFPGIYVTEDGYFVDEYGDVYDEDGDLIEEDALIINEGYVNEMNWGKIGKKLTKASNANYAKGLKAQAKGDILTAAGKKAKGMKKWDKGVSLVNKSQRQELVARRVRDHQRLMDARKVWADPTKEYGKTQSVKALLRSPWKNQRSVMLGRVYN